MQMKGAQLERLHRWTVHVHGVSLSRGYELGLSPKAPCSLLITFRKQEGRRSDEGITKYHAEVKNVNDLLKFLFLILHTRAHFSAMLRFINSHLPAPVLRLCLKAP